MMSFVREATVLRDSHNSYDHYVLRCMFGMARVCLNFKISEVVVGARVSAQTITDCEHHRVLPKIGTVTRLILFFESHGVRFDRESRSVRVPSEEDMRR